MEQWLEFPPADDQYFSQQWQVVKSLVVVIWEVNAETNANANNIRNQREKMRFIQPAESFYKKCLQIWMLEKCVSQQ